MAARSGDWPGVALLPGSPDGRMIAFLRSDGVFYVMNADGSAQRRLVPRERPCLVTGWAKDLLPQRSRDIYAIHLKKADGKRAAKPDPQRRS